MKSALLALAATALFSGCASNVPPSRQQQVDQINETGVYSYQRALGGPGR